MEELATSVLSYALWPLLTLAIVGLWVAATMDILRNRDGEAFTNVKLLCMATLVSVAAVRAYLFSFGLEHVSNITSVESTSATQRR
jgi:nitrate reductase NapE component